MITSRWSRPHADAGCVQLATATDSTAAVAKSMCGEAVGWGEWATTRTGERVCHGWARRQASNEMHVATATCAFAKKKKAQPAVCTSASARAVMHTGNTLQMK